MLSKYIVKAQKVLSKLDGTPIIVNPDNSVQVTYDGDTYRMLLEVLVACSGETTDNGHPLEAPVITPTHRERV